MPINAIASFTIPIPDNQQMTDYERKFKVAFTDEIEKLAGLIEAYNNEERREDKIEALSTLKRSFNIMQHRFPNNLKQDYHSIYHDQVVKPLFNNIRQDEVIEQAPSIVSIPRQDGNYPIHVAVLNGQLDVVQKLLSRPGVAEQKDANDNLPLHLAAAFGTLDMTQVCLHAYPQGINQSNCHAETPLDLAKQSNASDVCDYLIANNGTADPTSEWTRTQSFSPMS